jgi:hypothetical protein
MIPLIRFSDVDGIMDDNLDIDTVTILEGLTDTPNYDFDFHKGKLISRQPKILDDRAEIDNLFEL